jgi:hypothetical protein
MNNYQDNQEVNEFIQGMKHSIRETINEMINSSLIPDTIVFLLKRVEEGEVKYGMGGGAIPEDNFGRELAKGIIPTIIQQQGNEILCTCEAIKVNGEMKIKFINHITKDETFEIVSMEEKPNQVSDLLTNLCMN